MIGTNLYQFILQTPLQFQEGDIFGVFNDINDGERLVLYEQKFNGPINLRIEDSLDCPPSNISKMLTIALNDYPLVTPEISMYHHRLSSHCTVCVYLGISTQPTVTIASSTTENINVRFYFNYFSKKYLFNNHYT